MLRYFLAVFIFISLSDQSVPFAYGFEKKMEDILYHINGTLCWKNPKVYSNSYSYNDSGIVYYSNGKLCWKDPDTYNNSYSYNDSGVVYYSNGKLCWKDPDIYNTSSDYNNSGIVYYPDGKLCWKDPNIYNTSFNYNNSGAIYYPNGNLCWKDPKVYNSFYNYNDSGIIYHDNGQICWKDPSIYKDGGKCFDSEGNFISFSGFNSLISFESDHNSVIQIQRDGRFQLTIDMGYGNCFIRSYDESISVVQSLGSFLYLYVPCQGAPGKSIWIFNDEDNWIEIGKN
jgi:hypothetical protein